VSGLAAALAPIIKLILEAIFGIVWEKANEPTTVVDADSDPDLTARLRDRVRREKGSAGSGG